MRCSSILFLIISYKIFLEMADADPQLKRLLLPDEETTFEQFIRYGLYIAAIFQVVCLASLAFYPSGSSDGVAALKVLTFLFCFHIQL